VLLLYVSSLQSSRHTCIWVPSSIHHMPSIMIRRLIQQCLDARLHETPRASIQRFLLTPNDVLGVWVGVEILFQLRPGERIELLNAGDGRILETVGLSVFDESGVDLSCAEDDAVNFIRFNDPLAVFLLGNDPLEIRLFGEVFDVGAGDWVA